MKINQMTLAIAFLAITPFATWAQGTITACYVPKTGSVYRIKTEGAPDTCKPSHFEFSWKSGGIVYTQRAGTGVVVAPNAFEQPTAVCEAGETAVGGGHATSPNGTVSVAVSSRINPPTEGWWVDIRNLSGVNVTAWALVICAKPAG